MKQLAGKIAVVAGATRGAGRGIACMLGELGATVYCTGRSSRHDLAKARRPETIEETAEMVTAWGGHGIAVQVDHTVPEQVKALFERIDQEQQGQLDILVNDIWGGDSLTKWETPFWEHSLEDGLKMQKQAIWTHLITSHYGVPLMIKRKRGIVFEITDGDTQNYRGNLYYDLVKASVIRLAFGMAQELKPHNITALAVTPGFLRSEEMLDLFGVTEENWRDGAQKSPHFIASETPYYVGRAVACLAADPNVMEKTGGVYASWTLVEEYDFKDMDGRQPHWGRYYKEYVEQEREGVK